MSKIIGVTVGTPIKIDAIKEKLEIPEGGGTVVSSVEPAEDDIPKVFFSGDTTGMTKDVEKVLQFSYKSQTADFSGHVKMKWQGSSTLAFPKKNFTIKMFKDEACENKLKKAFKHWGHEKNKYVLKADYIDHTHARNIITANLWTEMVASRHDFDSLPEGMRNAPGHGAIDGFPIKLYMNGVYQGVYTWTIGKEDWMFGMDEDNANNAVLCAEKNNNGNKSTTDRNILACEFRGNANIDGNDWDLEFPETLNDNIKASFNALIDCVKGTDDETFKATIRNHLDLTSAFDYYILAYLSANCDGLGKNLIMMTYDGVKWFCSAYDMDNIWGSRGTNTFVNANYACPEDYYDNNSLLWQRIETCFGAELYARYLEVRKTVLSFENVIDKFERFCDLIGTELYAEDVEIYSGIPYPTQNNLKQIRNFFTPRAEYVDACFAEIGESGGNEGGESGGDEGGGEDVGNPDAVTSLFLSKDSLTFTKPLIIRPNDEIFTDAQPLDFTQGYNLGSTGVPTQSTGTTPLNDHTTLDVIPVDMRSTFILNPKGNTIRALTYYDESEAVVNHHYAKTITDKIIAVPHIYNNSATHNAKYMRIQTQYEPSHMYVAKANKWTKLETELVPTGTNADTYTGAIIPATKGNVVIMRSVGNSAEYFTGFCSYVDENGKGTGFITRYCNTKMMLQCAEITDDTCAYIGFKLNRALYNEGGYIEYCIIDSIDDVVTTEYGDYNTENVTAIIAPSDASNKNVTWSVDNDIVELNASGLTCTVTAKSAGTATLTCTAEDTTNGTVKDTCAITVEALDLSCTGISLSASELTFTEEGSQTLTATLTPVGCADSVTWTSDNPDVARVVHGVVTAVNSGNAVITAACGNYSATCSVSVTIELPVPSYIYQMEAPKTFGTVSDVVNTGVAPLSSDSNWSIALDMTPNAHTSEVCVFVIKDTLKFVIHPKNFENCYGFVPNGKFTAPTRIPMGTTENVKVVLVHESGTGIVTAHYICNGDIGTVSFALGTSSNALYIGADDGWSTPVRPWAGVMNSFEIQDRAMTEREILGFFGVNSGMMLYQMEEATTFGTVSDAVNTGVPLWGADRSFTIALSMTPEVQSAEACVFSTYTTYNPSTPTMPFYGIDLFCTNGGQYRVRVNASKYADTGIGYNCTDEVRMVITHKAGSGEYKAYYKSNGTTASQTITAAYTTQANNIYIGVADGWATPLRPWAGTMNAFEIHGAAFTAEEAEAFVNG